MKYFWAIIAFLLVAVAIFMIVSLSLSSAHSVDLIQEWKNWFGIVSNNTEAVSLPLKAILRI